MRQSEEGLRNAVEAAGMGTWDWRLATDEVFWNERHFVMLGMEPQSEPLKSTAFFDHVHPDDRAWVRGRLEEALENRSVFHAVFRALTEGGQERWMEGYGQVVEAEGGQARRMSGAMFDITERRQAEERLRASEEKFRTLFTSIDEGFYLAEVLWDDAGRATDVLYLDENPAAIKIIGQPLKDRLLSGLGAEHEAYWLDIFGRTARTGEAQRLQRYAGLHRKWFDFSVFKPQGTGAGTIAILFRDITERKAGEERLRQSEARFRTLSDTVPQLIWTNDARGRANYFNRRWFEFSGLSPEASEGLGWQAIVHPEDAPASIQRWRRSLASGTVFDTEFRLRRADGVFRWHILRNVPLRDAGGQMLGWFGSATDIEDLKRAEAAQRESEERFRLLVEGARDYALFLMDTRRRIIHWNSGAERLFGYSRDQAIGQSGDMIFTPEDIASGSPEHEAEAAAREGSAVDVRWHLRRDGSGFWADGVMSSLRDEAGELRGFVKIARDSTKEREAEEELRRAHDELEARVRQRTRELRAEVAQRKALERERKRLLRAIVAAQEEERRRLSRELHDQMGQTLTALMLGLKMLPVAGSPGPARPTPAERLESLQELAGDLASYAHHLAWELRPATLDNIGLEAAVGQYVSEWSQRVGVPADFVALALSDRERLPADVESTLYRVAQEALSNVARHARASQVSVLLERRGSQLLLVAEDDGVGFDPSQRTNRLGLVGMRERLELIGGSLTIESAPGQGTVIYARVPLERRADP